jgi:hypothetical protein
MPATVTAAPRIDSPAWGSLVPAGPDLWRVREHRGRILGHVRALPGARGEDERFRAERFRPARGGFVVVGEFRSSRDAVASLRG